ncbi:hypothetical protein BDDG_01556 [Blastomyces dermatitidis ATCC 18188]|uniref:Uncharacterized protein n=2 Tax=Ajellomyces dermatitidis TaxID=5039 RepID=F2T5V6_AJEDA|nr:hypothetical protein BDDG_01556 [Blastomyces dermatitidis ATCC 18188]
MPGYTHSTYLLGLASVVLVGLAIVIGTFFVKLYHARMLLIDRRRSSLTFLTGLPRDAHYQFGLATIAREQFYETGGFYIDRWPMSGLFVIVVSPTIGMEITQQNPRLASNRPKQLCRYLKPTTGGPTILDMDEKEWKPWRGIYNKAFHRDRVISLVPCMVEEVLVYAETFSGDRRYVLFGSNHASFHDRYNWENKPADLVALGPNAAATAIVIRGNPRVINSLQYTLAVIRESRRLFPPAGATRAGKRGISVTDDAGNVCSTDDAIL